MIENKIKDANYKSITLYENNCFEWYGKEEYYIILTEELLNWLEKIGYYIDTIEFLRDTHLEKYVYVSYYGDPFDEEAKKIVEEKIIDLYGSFELDDIDSSKALEGIRLEFLDDKFMDDVADDLKDDYNMLCSNIDELVFIRSILQVLNDKN